MSLEWLLNVFSARWIMENERKAEESEGDSGENL